MENKDNILNELLARFNTCQPQLSHPDRTVDNVLHIIKTERRNKKIVIALRCAGMAALLFLIFGLAATPNYNIDTSTPTAYQSNFLSQRIDMDYVRTKLADETIYDKIKKQAPYEKYR